MVRSRTTIATPPGATIKEQLIYREMSQKEFAQRMDISQKHISKLINGEVQLTSDMALRLEMVLGVPAQFWNNLEAIYREKLSKVEAENEMDADVETVKIYPYNEMAKMEWVLKTNKPTERVVNLRKFFEVVKLSLLDDALRPQMACRRFTDNEKTDCALRVWAQKAKLEARKIETKTIDLKKLTSAIPQIRKMTLKKLDVIYDELIDLLAECGIALIILPHIEGSTLQGVTFYDGKKIVIGMTVRGKFADIFWFSLFHEIAHVLLGHIDKSDEVTDEDEADADAFAQKTLIPQELFDDFIAKGKITTTSINRFAKTIGISAGIVVGRLQKERHIGYFEYNEMKTQYQIPA